MTPEEQRLYEELSEMTGATPTAERMLDEDAGLRACLGAITGQKPATLDDFLQCYDGQDEPTDNAEEREFSEVEERMYEEFSEMMDVPIRPTPEPSDTGYVLVPADLVKQIDRTYEEVRRSGHLTPSDFENELYEWISRG